MPDAALDACCLIDLLASGEAEAILRANGLTWRLPSAVAREVKYQRQHDPDRPGKVIETPVDLSAMISSGLLNACDPRTPEELDGFARYASVFRSDGEAMCLAIAEARQWVVATDDRRAIRIARQAGLKVLSCPELVKTWALATCPQPAALTKVLRDIQTLAQFRPNSTMPEYSWWLEELARNAP